MSETFRPGQILSAARLNRAIEQSNAEAAQQVAEVQNGTRRINGWKLDTNGARNDDTAVIGGQFYFQNSTEGALFRAQGFDPGVGESVGFIASVYSPTSPVVFVGHRDAGTRDAPLPVPNGQLLVSLTGKATINTAGAQSNAGAVVCMAIADQTPSSAPSRWRITTTNVGAITPTATFDVAISDGLRFNGQLILNADRHFVLRSYTVSTLPVAGAPARLIVVSDGSSFRRLAIADGGVWRFMDGAIVS